MTPPPPLYHALLRPAILQILRAAGYHAAKTNVLDTVTDLAARYLSHLCQLTALYASHNNEGEVSMFDMELLDEWERARSEIMAGANGAGGGQVDGGGDGNAGEVNGSGTGYGNQNANGVGNVNGASVTSSAPTKRPIPSVPVPVPTIVDVRMALQRAGAFMPERIIEEQEYLGVEDLRGVESFIAWATGPVNREIKRIALDGNDEASDYLDALKKKHSKNDDDSKYLGTLLGRSIDFGEEIVIEGWDCPSIEAWEERMRRAAVRPRDANADGQAEGVNGNGEKDSRPGSSGLSSLGDRSIAEDMDLS